LFHFRFSRPLLAGLALVMPASLATEVLGGVALVSQERGVGASASYDGNPTPLSKIATGFELFDETASAAIVDQQDGDGAKASASQKSVATASGISTAGRFEFLNSGEYADAVSKTSVIFDVTNTPQAYSLKYSLQSSDDSSQTTLIGFPIATVDFRRIDPAGDSVVGPDSIALVDLNVPPVPPDALFEGAGVLQPGRYELFVLVGGIFPRTGEQSHVGSVDYAVSLSFDDGAVAVPLPPAVWGGLATLGGMGLMHLRRRRAALSA